MIKKPYLIAEIGINHNGSLEIAKNLIEEACKAGFDAVKFQKRDIDLVYSKEILDSPRESPWGTTQRDQKKGLEFGRKEYDEIDNYSKLKKIDCFLDKYDLKFNKIASAMIVDINFLRNVAKRQKHTFISTGMSTEENINNAVKIFREEGCSFELMHCVSTYPTKDEDTNLLTINSLKKKYNCKVGYSGHENGVAVSLAALCLGISSLERHITLDRTMYGSDQSASLEKSGMNSLTIAISKIIKALGTEKLGYVSEEEALIAKKLRAHIK